MLTQREALALEACRANLDKVEPNADYVGSGKFAAGPADNPSRGKCYLASAALSEYLGGVRNGYHLAKAENHLGIHYWVVSDAGTILDPTKEQFEIIGERPPYRHGRRVQKRNTLKKHLPLLEAMGGQLDSAEADKPAVDIFGRPLTVEKGRALSDAQEQKLNAAWRAVVAEWADRPDEFIRCTFSKGTLAVQFVRALLYGEAMSGTATMAYVPDRYYVPGGSGKDWKFSEMLPDALVRDNILRGVRFLLNGEVSFTKLIGGNLPISGYRMPFDFPIGLAKDLINKYCPAGGVVLDPCHGWGGRMVGFMLSHATAYVGIDPAPHSPKLREMFDDLSVYLPEPKKLRLINKPFEDTNLSEAAYDFALTSPPYFNTEHYLGEESSWRRYPTLDTWIDGFYRRLIGGVAEALRPGAYFVLQVTPKFRMVEVAKEAAATVGLEYARVHDTSMRRYNSASADKAGATDLFEVFIVFRKV